MQARSQIHLAPSNRTRYCDKSNTSLPSALLTNLCKTKRLVPFRNVTIGVHSKLYRGYAACELGIQTTDGARWYLDRAALALSPCRTKQQNAPSRYGCSSGEYVDISLH